MTRFTQCKHALLKTIGVATLMLGFVAEVHATEIRELTWADLRPQPVGECKKRFEQRRDPVACKALVFDLTSLRCGAQTVDIDGERVRIAGYAHPLSFEFKNVERFHLSPVLGPCAHSLPPLANQVILVESSRGIEIGLDPVYVTGLLSIRESRESTAISQYYIRAESIEPALIPDVISLTGNVTPASRQEGMQ